MLVLGVRVNDMIMLSNGYNLVITDFNDKTLNLTVMKKSYSKDCRLPLQADAQQLVPQVFCKYLSLKSRKMAHIGFDAPNPIRIFREKAVVNSIKDLK